MNSNAIYPKQFVDARIRIERKSCFMIMPFDKKFNPILGFIRRDLSDAGYACKRSDDVISKGSVIMNKILNLISKSHFIIADITGFNPNVLYELGVAHTLRDIECVILISQDKPPFPFDFAHMKTIVYQPDNPQYLTSQILGVLKENYHAVIFREILLNRNIYPKADNVLISSLEDRLDGLIPIIVDILDAKPIKKYSNKKITALFVDLGNALRQETAADTPLNVRHITKIIAEILIDCSKLQTAASIIKGIFEGDWLKEYGVSSKQQKEDIQTSLAIRFAEKNVKLEYITQWMINRFSESEAANVNENRDTIKHFLSSKNVPKINKSLVDALSSENSYIREAMANIVAKKGLKMAGDILVKQLVKEDNFYTAGSFITAIGELKNVAGVPVIFDWVEKHVVETKKAEHLQFILNRSEIALSQLDKVSHSNDCLRFRELYKDLFKQGFHDSTIL